MDEVQRLLAEAHGLESAGRNAQALDAYQAAFERSGQDPAIAGDIGRLALRMGQHAIAEQLLVIHLQAHPQSLEGRLLLAHALREQHRYDEALTILTPAVQAHPAEHALWTALGILLVQQGRPDEALTFLDEALRLEPQSGGAFYARGNALADLGEHARAILDYGEAIARLPEADSDRVRTPLALSRLAVGDLTGGWEDYRARFSPHAVKPVSFEVDAQPWPFDPVEPADALRGRSLLLMAEQGLGDEVMFANVAPDVLRALGPDGRLTLAVEARLGPLFARSFPQAQVVAHVTRMIDGRTVRTAPASAEFWAPLGAPLRRFRRTVSDFPAGAYMRPDPARVAHWRGVLGQRPGLKVGLLWKSLKLEGERQRQFAPFELWAPVLSAPGASLVNLQYGDCAAELAYARDVLGADILQPPGIDLKQDLDDVAALCCALDLTVGFSNATFNLAGACGAPLWLISGPNAWTRLGTPAYPWYPQARCFSPGATGGWASVMTDVAGALAGLTGG